MSVSRLQYISNGAASGTSVTLSITVSAHSTLLVVGAVGAVSGFLSCSDGTNTYTSLHAGITWAADAWYAKDVAAGSLSIVVSSAGNSAYSAAVLELAGADLTSPIRAEKDAGTGTTSLDSGLTSAGTVGDYVVGLIAVTIPSTTPTAISARAFTTALTSQTDETEKDQVGATTTAEVAISHGPIAGANTEKVTATVPGSHTVAWGYCAIIKAAAATGFAHSQGVVVL